MISTRWKSVQMLWKSFFFVLLISKTNIIDWKYSTKFEKKIEVKDYFLLSKTLISKSHIESSLILVELNVSVF